MFDPWTASLDEAITSQEATSENCVHGPIFQWSAARKIEAEREAVENGDGFAVLACIRRCVTNNLVAPEWLAYAFNRRYDKVLNCHVRSWDEAFGKPYPGKSISDLRRRRELRFAVLNAVNNIRCQPGRAIDESLFEEVGAEFGIKKTLCSELYYEAKALLPQDSAKT